MNTLSRRLSAAFDLYREEAYLRRMSGGRAYEIHLMQQQLDWDIEHNVPGPRPTRFGLWLITVADDIAFLARLAAYVLTARAPRWWWMN